MKTHELLDLLAKDQLFQKRRSFALFALAGALVLLAYIWINYSRTSMGVRLDYFDAVGHFGPFVKQFLPLAMGLSFIPFVRSLYYPEAPLARGRFAMLFLYGVLMAGLFAWAWVTTSEELRVPLLMGSSNLKCLVTIPIFSWVVMGFVFFSLKGGAPQNPLALSVCAALFSSGIATAIYAIGCTEDSPLFFALWYNLAILIATVIGAAIGARWLKW